VIGYLRNFPHPPLSPETVPQLKRRKKAEKGNGQADEKALDLPARSRFGEGRAEPLGVWIQKPHYHEKTMYRAPRKLGRKPI